MNAHNLTLVQSGLLQLIHDEFRVAGSPNGWWAVTNGQDVRADVAWQDVEALRKRSLVTVFVSTVPAVWYDRQVELTAAGLSYLYAQGVNVTKAPPPFRGYEMAAIDVAARRHPQPQTVKAPEPPPPPRNNEMTALEVDARRKWVLEMHDAGMRQKDIAETLAVSQSRSHQLLHTALRDRDRQTARQHVMAKVATLAVRERRIDLLRSAERRACAALGEVSVRRALAQWAKLGSHDNRGAPP